jgi:integrase
VRYYVDGVQKSVLLCKKSAAYRTREDVAGLMARVMDGVNSEVELTNGQATIQEFFDGCYLPWTRETKAAATADCYRKLFRKIEPKLARTALADVDTAAVTRFLTRLANDGLGACSLGHVKWFLSGIFNHAVALGIVSFNPVPKAKALVRPERKTPPAVYSLETVLRMIAVLEPVNLQAAVAVSLSFFAGLRPSESRGLRWADWTGEELTIRRAIWRNVEGRTKTPESAATIPCIEPLRSLLAKLHGTTATDGYILRSSVGTSLNLDTLKQRVIAPTMKAHGIPWSGLYPCRRGISSLLTASSKDALNSTGLLRHSNPMTALQHYTRPNKDNIATAMREIERMATK